MNVTRGVIRSWSDTIVHTPLLACGLAGLNIVYNIKFGTWTMLFWSLYWARTGDLNPVSLLMFATHFGMAIEGLLLCQYLDRANLRNTLIVLAWMILPAPHRSASRRSERIAGPLCPLLITRR